jgi:predicted metal-dependent HD superfamily phosphohydrolase
MTRFKAATELILNQLVNELDPNLTYHSVRHTKDVIGAAEEIAKSCQLDQGDIDLLIVASAFHDCGFLRTYKDHEEAGCDIVRELLPPLGFNQNELDVICGMIMATKIPQSPENLMQKVICDADLDYLGRSDFERISNDLYKEFTHFGIVSSYEHWMSIQISFIGNHAYWTESAIADREEGKQQHLAELKRIHAPD